MNEHGFGLAPEPQIRIHPSMLFTAEKILKKKLARDQYENLFTPETSPQAKAEIEKINLFLQYVMPLINAGKKPNIQLVLSLHELFNKSESIGTF